MDIPAELKFDHIYPFVQEHDQPFRLFDDISERQSFEKTFTLDNSTIKLKSHIQQHKDGFDWILERDTDQNDLYNLNFVHHRFGLAFQIDKQAIRLHDGHQPFSVLVHFSRTWIPTWLRQTNTDLPIIQIKAQNRNMLIATSIDSTVQFHQYNDGDARYVSVSTITYDSLQLKIIVRQSDECNYYHLFPGTNSIRLWETQFNKLQEKFGIEINYVRKGEIVDNFSEDDAFNYAAILDCELDKYPKDFFTKNHINRITLINRYEDSGIISAGSIDKNGLILNTTSYLSEMHHRLAVHHEICHFIDKSPDWNFPLEDSFSLAHLLKIKDISDCNEYKAHLFAYAMLDLPFVEYLCLSDYIVKAKFAVIISIMEEHGINPVRFSDLHSVSLNVHSPKPVHDEIVR